MHEPTWRFWTHVVCDVRTRCWEWTAGVDKDGYGLAKVRGKTMGARLRWLEPGVQGKTACLQNLPERAVQDRHG
jgi:hypothetical protein